VAADADPTEVLERQLAEVIKRVRDSAVALEYASADGPSGGRRIASGVVISDGGEVLSIQIAAPATSSPSSIVARVASGRSLEAKWIASDPETGLTLLRIAPGMARPAAPAPRGPRLGVPVLVIGNPFGLAHSVSRGYVSGLHRRLELGPRQLGGLIQVDAALHPGDSGALLADLRGGWLGVIRSDLAAPAPEKEKDRSLRGREYDHDLGFAIPARIALWVAAQLRDHKRVDRAYLGVTMDRTATVPPGEPEGAVLKLVLADTPAERAGLKEGDRVVAIDSRPVRSPDELTDRLDLTPADSVVTLDLLRGPGPARTRLRLTFRAARRPPFEPSQSAPSPVTASSGAASKGRSDDPKPALQREVVDKIDRLEHRLDLLEKEKRESATAQQPQ
jgi:S1-C subfamily serine protease